MHSLENEQRSLLVGKALLAIQPNLDISRKQETTKKCTGSQN